MWHHREVHHGATALLEAAQAREQARDMAQRGHVGDAKQALRHLSGRLKADPLAARSPRLRREANELDEQVERMEHENIEQFTKSLRYDSRAKLQGRPTKGLATRN